MQSSCTPYVPKSSYLCMETLLWCLHLLCIAQAKPSLAQVLAALRLIVRSGIDLLSLDNGQHSTPYILQAIRLCPRATIDYHELPRATTGYHGLRTLDPPHPKLRLSHDLRHSHLLSISALASIG